MRGIEWTISDIGILETHYGKIPVSEIRERFLPDRSEAAIRVSARRFGFAKFLDGWTDSEVAFLEKNLFEPDNKYLARILGKTRIQVKSKKEKMRAKLLTERRKFKNENMLTRYGMRWPADEIADVEEYAAENGLRPTEAIRDLVRAGLSAKKDENSGYKNK